jgi:hypothetical protein
MTNLPLKGGFSTENMTSQKLYGILRFVDELDKKLGLQSKLEAVATSLTSIVSQPAEPSYQSTLASALAAFEEAAARLGESISPSQFAMIREMGGEEFFDPAIAGKVKGAVQLNAMTPTVARDVAQELAKRRADFLSTVRSALQDLQRLKISGAALEPGAADLAFLIPRHIFDNDLARFAKELTFLNRLLQHFSEGLTGETEHIQLEELSSSTPTVALLASVPVIGALSFIVTKFLEAWEKVEKIRLLRAQVLELGMKGKAVEEFTEQITATVDEVVEEATETILVKFPGTKERRNELATAIRQDTHRLFGQIERGLTVEFRAEPQKDEDSEKQKVLTEIADRARMMQFPPVVPEPLLLQSGEILEGEIQAVKRSKKTTTHKTTVSTKAAPKESGGTEPKE